MLRSRLTSVIIPTYNRGALVRDAIESVLGQHMGDGRVEVIVVDDGSTDDTREVVAGCLRRDSVRYVLQQHKGAGAARNRGIAEARGDWVAFLDSDDRWLPCHLPLHLAVADRLPGCKALFSDFRIVELRGPWEGRGLDFWTRVITGDAPGEWKRMFSTCLPSESLGVRHEGETFSIYRGHIFRHLLTRPVMPCWTTVVSREALGDTIRFPEHLPTWEDWWFACLLAEEHEVCFLDTVTAENRGHDGPRLSQASLVTRQRCLSEIYSEVYLKSRSPHRPSDADLIGAYGRLQKSYFEELLKNGSREEALRVRDQLETMGLVPKDLRFLLFWATSVISPKAVERIARLKRRIQGVPNDSNR